MAMKPWPALAIRAALLVAVTAVPATADEPSAPERSRLSHLVRHDCGSCHGMTLKGGLGGPLLPANLEGASTEGLAEVILDGIPDTPMPPWRSLLSESDALWIARALKEGRIE